MNNCSREDGMALLLSLLFISVALIAIATLSTQLMGQRVSVGHYQTYVDTFEAVEAAVSVSRSQLESGNEGSVGLEDWTPVWDGETNELVWPEMDDVPNPLTLEDLPGVRMATFANAWMGDGRDSNGDGTVDDNGERNMWTVYAMAEQDQMLRRLEVVYEGLDINVWRNAIFAGGGAAGNVISGNVSIHGAVHILGDNLLLGNPAITAIDLTGTSLIHNNYEGMPNALRNRVPPLLQKNFQGEMVQTLEANLRVKRGKVSMSGNSEVGQNHIGGNNYKETMDGTFVTDGWTGNSVVPDGDRGDPKSVYSDNGWDETYDLGNKVPFPMLTDDWRWPITGARETNPATGTWYTHQDFFNEVLLADPNNTSDGRYNGTITLNARGANVYWNASTNTYTNTLPGTLPPADQDWLVFNAASNVLRVNGQLTIDGGLIFTGQGNDRTINYSGRAAILVNGNITIDTNLITCNDGNPANTAASFPVNNILGLMATNNMMVGSAAQLDIMGAFYATNTITTMKQTNVVGTFVSTYFNMGSNVPNIFQVPALADNLPLGMIGNYPILTLDQKAWREIGVG